MTSGYWICPTTRYQSTYNTIQWGSHYLEWWAICSSECVGGAQWGFWCDGGLGLKKGFGLKNGGAGRMDDIGGIPGERNLPVLQIQITFILQYSTVLLCSNN